MTLALLAAFALVASAAVLWAPRWRARRRERLRQRPFPRAWQDLLLRDMALYRRLPTALRERLHGHVHVLLVEKQFVGCAGLEVTESMRVLIAAHAAVLLLGDNADYYPGFTGVLVYPETFVVPRLRRDGPLEQEEEEARAGEAWQHGPVVLSWADILRNADAFEPRHNVVLHEFAHKLDGANGAMDGLPPLATADDVSTWAGTFGAAYAALQASATGAAPPALLDAYGASAPAEFFAVATETFFERSRLLAGQHPALYAALARYYRVDPATWPAQA